ncbi:MAG: TetR/AcrR family transcriptional regulator [Saprospiraceae bacterium]|nr:TetR/AcrR family transcriptional regulator [Saprospiraceae bacterium]
MATKAKTSKSGSQGNTEKELKEQLKDNYKQYILLNGHEPSSIFLFMKELDLREDDFYKHYGSFHAIESSIWLDFINETVEVITSDPIYQDYSARERLLAFYYTLMERLKKDRSYVKFTVENNIKRPEILPQFLQKFRSRFLSYVEELIHEGLDKGEIVNRPVISKRYKDGLWLQLIFVINFWLKDDSANFENTDAAIEKSVNLAFEFMGEGPLEKVIDFAKFLYQNRWK